MDNIPAFRFSSAITSDTELPETDIASWLLLVTIRLLLVFFSPSFYQFNLLDLLKIFKLPLLCQSSFHLSIPSGGSIKNDATFQWDHWDIFNSSYIHISKKVVHFLFTITVLYRNMVPRTPKGFLGTNTL